MRKEGFRTITAVFGLLLAVGILFSSFSTSGTNAEEKAKQAQSEKTDDDKSEQNICIVSAVTIAPSSVVTIQSNFIAHFLFEILQPGESEHTESADQLPHSEKLLLTLFRVIISPNAP
jgi:hypothetical protein